MAKENVTIRNFDKELWFQFVAKVKMDKKTISEVLEPMLKEYLKKGKK